MKAKGLKPGFHSLQLMVQLPSTCVQPRHAGLLLLVDLALVHDLLQRAGGEEAVHVHIALLADTVRAVLRLHVAVQVASAKAKIVTGFSLHRRKG